MKIQVDGKPIEYVGHPKPLSDAPDLGIGHLNVYDTPKQPATVGPANGRM